MSLALQFLIVSASIISRVLCSDSSLQTCQQQSADKFNERSQTQEYEIYLSRVNSSDIIFKKNFQTRVIYAYVSFTTIDFSLSEVSNDNQDNGELFWKHVGHAAVAAHIVRNDSHWQFQVGDADCHVTTFTTNEQWGFKNRRLNYEVDPEIEFPPKWYFISDAAKMAVRKIGLSCLSEQICEKVKTALQFTNPNSMEETLPIMLSVLANEAVDKSIIILRKDIKKDRHTIPISDVRKSFVSNETFPNTTILIVATGGTLTNLSTIERSSDAVAEIQPDNYTITSTYTLREAQIHYDNCTMHFEGTILTAEMFISIEDLQITSSLNVTDCDQSSQHVNITNIGEMKYEFRRSHLVNAALFESKGNVLLWARRHVKELIEPLLAKALDNAFAYSDTIFGPCMTRLPRMDFPLLTS